ncbi:MULTISPECIES: exodeoxyribonuclease I [unclassified Pseudomonas]|uniref:exodeoxyribonuclease I n=1 Tax=unclassified Pseudomonas TaxID=196821 RepID=UPI000BDC3F81|nr:MULTISPECIES: exodeoxyribonuclease I [unclassified Pseudomonas]PVZ11194.1 exodeoxyribonuclease I subunit C [Pseudomonas sp. URIL14HWK12:I12]PVZ22192.1 exodeoxyribonuclease I subunit C [Pseudomonas sp. URIL14HWK12:I10]PVZ31684.1 exodeoxyribonuclease I subunit C [Pseudomonas sp. URIL14HWK12:I11]SNZ16797.1 Exodeoxyribonuclease I subunit C [Pseudomonas sp. URIL14HWK12:I9]
MTASIFWYDYETTGIDPRCDRPLQVAGLRTDHQLNVIDEPLNLYCRPSDDILPHPAACRITGITPQILQARGLSEAAFMARVHEQLSRPGTCGAGYNTLRFDDEVTRYSLYRNFYDPYAREWQGGNSRWDLIDIVRAAYALRPDGIEWPERDGQVSLKLEALTAANRLEHGQAHDALSDVYATIALAKLIRARQPKLFDWFFQLRGKRAVTQQIHLMQPLVHISGRFSAARSYLGVVLPLAWHPVNRNALIVCDLHLDPAVLWELTPEALAKRLYTRREELAEGERPVPLKLIHVNRCPVIAPMSVLREQDRRRLGLDMEQLKQHAQALAEAACDWPSLLAQVYRDSDFATSEDPEQQLYNGFIAERDRRLCDQVRSASASALGNSEWIFDDARLTELLWRYRARNFPEALDALERQRWQSFCRARLSEPKHGAPHTVAQFEAALADYDMEAEPVLQQWAEYVHGLRERFGL